MASDKMAIASRDRGGLYYKDPYGKTQGPFTQEHIQVCHACVLPVSSMPNGLNCILCKMHRDGGPTFPWT